MTLSGKKIVVGITGGIAAYKTTFLIRMLRKAGAEVKVVMTPGAKQFVTPLTMGTLSGNPVWTEFENGTEGVWNNHVELALWADMMVIAPLTAHTLSKLASGRSDNLLMAVYLSAKCPVVVAPAMDLDMYKHDTTQDNLRIIQSHGVQVITARYGELASGLVGEGRMEKPEQIFEFIRASFLRSNRLAGKHIVVTAGPTYEAIDAVRFIGNYSSGKMGVEVANALARQGARVTLVAGPMNKFNLQAGVQRVDVRSAEEMLKAVEQHWSTADAGIFAAAVADFRPKQLHSGKIKKEEGGLQHIELEETPDILAFAGTRKKVGQVLIGFALETANEEQNALSKLKRKNLDAIVLNSLRDAGAGFGTDTNKISILGKDGNSTKFELKPKREVAEDISDYLVQLLSHD